MDPFNVEQGVAQGCSLSPILFSVFINDLLKEVEQAISKPDIRSIQFQSLAYIRKYSTCMY